MTVNWKSVSQPPPNGAVVPQTAQALNGLRPPILEQTGGFVTGAETDKLRLQNRRLMTGIHDVFPADIIDNNDPISVKKLLKGEGQYLLLKTLLGFNFDGK